MDQRPALRSRSRLLIMAAVIAVVTAMTGWLGMSPAHAATGPTISSWVTTPDRSQLLAQGSSAALGTGTPQGNTITVDPDTTYQTMDGFGASITDSAAYLLYQLPQSQRDSVMRSIFSPTAGIGMSLLRQPLGASDLVNGAFYTYDDMPAGQTDPTLANFSIAHDQAQIIPLLRQAISLNPQVKVMIAPWGQPAWMKDNGSLVGGHILPQYYQAYANYLLKSIQAYEAAGVPIYAISVQNEPQNRTPLGYPGTDMPVAAEAAIINDLGPLLRDNGLGGVKIIAFDHNWALHPNDAASAQALGEDPEPNYASDILNTSAAQWIAGDAFHCYYGDASAQSAVHNAFPDKDIWFTECSGSHDAGQPLSQYFHDTLNWQATNVLIPTIQNWAKSISLWSLALDSNGNPHNQGCGTCTGVVAIDGTTVTYNAEYYLTGHLSKFVQPGAVRIGANNAGDLRPVAFRNPDGGYAMVVSNVGGGTQTLTISFNGQLANFTVAPNALLTFTWAGTTTGPTPTPTATQTVTPSPPVTPTPTPTGSTGAIDPTKWYWVTNTNSGKCLDAKDGGTGNGTAVQQWTCYGGNNNQLWQFQPTDDGYYRVVARNASTQVWDVTGGPGATGNGVKIQLWSYAGGTNQQWKPVLGAGGVYTFTPRNNSAECLDVTDVSTADGALLQQWSCTGGPAQAFRLTAQS